MGKDESTICKQNINEITLTDIINSLNKSSSEHNSTFEISKKDSSSAKVSQEEVFKEHNRNGLPSLILAHSNDLTKTLNKLKETEKRFKEVLASSKDFLRSKISTSKYNEKENYTSYKHTAIINGIVKELPKEIKCNIECTELITNQKKLLDVSNIRVQEEYASNRTESIFKEYTLKEPQMLKTNYITQLSVVSSLRYINFQDLIHKLKTLADGNNDIITKTDLVESITSMLKKHNNNEDVLHELLGEELLFEEVIGALAVLCKGGMEDNIQIAFLYLGSNNNTITLKILYKFLLSTYKIMLSQVKSSVKNSDISAEELAHLTSIQCFDDHTRMHNSNITTEEFIMWFRSQARTLVADSVQSMSLKEMYSISIHINSASEELSCSVIKDENIQEQWNKYFKQYYMIHGYYPHPPLINPKDLV